MKSKSNGTRDFRIACTSNSFLLVLCRQISDGRWMDNEKWFQQILMWILISIYFGCTFITRTFCDTEIYLLNYLCKADTEVTEKIKLDILRSCLSFRAVDRYISKYLQGDFWLILSMEPHVCWRERILCSVIKPFNGSGSASLKLLLDIRVKSLELMDYKWFK